MRKKLFVEKSYKIVSFLPLFFSQASLQHRERTAQNRLFPKNKSVSRDVKSASFSWHYDSKVSCLLLLPNTPFALRHWKRKSYVQTSLPLKTIFLRRRRRRQKRRPEEAKEGREGHRQRRGKLSGAQINEEG